MLLFKHALGGLLPGLTDCEIANIREVLDIKCGSGVWALDLAQTYHSRNLRITGIDTSHDLISYARAEARARRLTDVHYLQLQSLPSLAFPDESFDLISGQFLSYAIHRTDWSVLIQRCFQLLRPGGWLRFTDFEAVYSNAPAHNEVIELLLHAMRLQGSSFSTCRQELGGLTPVFRLLETPVFSEVRRLTHRIEYSAGTSMHTGWVNDFQFLSHLVKPILVSRGLVHPEYLDRLLKEQQREMQSNTFQAVCTLGTIWGLK